MALGSSNKKTLILTVGVMDMAAQPEYQSSVTLVLAAVLTFLVVSYLLGLSSKRSSCNRYPPGPMSFPLIGNLPQIALCGSVDVFFEKYRKIYGNVSNSVLVPSSFNSCD